MDIDKLMNELSEDELKNLTSAIRNKREKEQKENIFKTIEEHKAYIGKCYKKEISFGLNKESGYRYIKLIRAESENEYWMEALVFENPVHYQFNYQSHMMHHRGDYFFGHINYEGIRVDSIGWFTTAGQNGYEEISLEEFNKALDEHVKELKKMNWGK